MDLTPALDYMSDGFAVFDTDDQLVVHNARFLEMFPFLERLGDLRGLNFYALASAPCGEWSRVDDPDAYVDERMKRHQCADGTPFDIPLEAGGWARVRERRMPDGCTVSVWTDISELRAAEQQLLGAINGIGEGFIHINGDGTIRLANARVRSLFGAVGVEIHPGDHIRDVMRKAFHANMFAAPQTLDDIEQKLNSLRDSVEMRVEGELRDGTCVLVSYRRMDDGSSVSIWTDVTTQKRRETELIQMREQLRQQADAIAEFARLVARQARSDLLTGLPNRFALEERLGQMLDCGDDESIWVGFIDIDHFRNVNEKVGHAAADDLLQEFVTFLRSHLRSDDMLARVGGDSFALLLTGLETHEARSIAERLGAAVHAHPFRACGQTCTLTLSIGLARAGGAEKTPSAVLVAADTACCLAKEAGRDRVTVYDVGDPKVSDSHEHLNWAERINSALEFDRLNLDLQAIVGKDGAVLGYEALLRLTDDTGQVHAPTKFLPAARRLGLMRRIDEWVCRRAITYAARLHARRLGQYISVNFGARSLADVGFQQDLLGELDRYPGIESSIRIEITETETIADLGEITDFLERLRQRGVRVALDDFGNGYNSFEVLKQLPVDVIKIDWTVTRDLLVDPIDEALMKAAISIAHSLTLELVAEGVETQIQLDKLQALGVETFQGHLFQFPMAAEKVFA